MAGELSADGSRWHSTSPLAADAHYTVRVSTEDEDGAPGRKALTFDTSKPTAKKRLNVTFGPDAGHVRRRPARHRRAQRARQGQGASAPVVERALKVDSTPAVEGAWHWVDDKKLHYRPKEYWPAHATDPGAQQPGGHQDRRPALGRQGQAAEAHHRRPRRSPSRTPSAH